MTDEWRGQDVGDLVTSAFGRIHALEARDRARPDDLEDTGSTSMAKMAPKKTSTPMTDAAIKQLIAQGVADALTEYEATRNSGAEGVIGLTQWFEKMKSVFYVRNCTVACQIKFATCTLLGSALTWWNSHVKTVGHDAAYGMTWKTLKKMMTDRYCPISEIKKLEIEIWNLKVEGTDVVSYTQCFQELALMCGRMFLKESDEVEKYVGGLPDMIQGSLWHPS
ncbi:reverse transcriptase domain-containing protein [Tanacetum coccineum]